MKPSARRKLLTGLISLILLIGVMAGGQQVSMAAPTVLPGSDMDCLRNSVEIQSRLTELVNKHANLAELVDIGDSWELMDSDTTTPGSDLMVLRLTNRHSPGPKPVLFVVSGLDSRDILGVELALRFAERLVTDYGIDPDVSMILDTTEVQLLVVANPDGRQELERELAADNDGVLTYDTAWGRNRNETDCALGVDLNRNFDSFDFVPSRTCLDTYPGPNAESEPEVRAIAEHLRALYPDNRTSPTAPVVETTAGLVVHLTDRKENHYVWYPYHTMAYNAENDDWIRLLASKVANTPGDGDPLIATKAKEQTRNGNLLDYAYGELGVAALEMRIYYPTILGSLPKCDYFEASAVVPWLNALLKAARSTARPFEFAQGPEITSISALHPLEPFSQTWNLSGTVDARDYQLLDASHLPANPFAVLYSKSLPPWRGIDVTPAEYTPTPPDNYSGVFSLQSEVDPAVEGGQESVYLQAVNENGKHGLPRAVSLSRINYLVLPMVLR